PLVHTIRAVGSVTNPMREVKPGAVLGVRGPFGSYWPVHRAKGNDIVIVSGGLGMAPLRPVIYHILANRRQYGRVSLLYGTRRPADMLYPAMIEDWGRRGIDVHLTVDSATPDWCWNVGLVTRLIPKARFDPDSTTAMVCGPDIMMRYVVAELIKMGLPSAEIFVSMERNMKCAIGLCGHCQFGPSFICKDGPVFPIDALHPFFSSREV
ncbi:MAG: FAD/NAD(P)-binding protein, partial [Blastocatellia bacterium]